MTKGKEIIVVSSDSNTNEDTIQGPSIESVPKEGPSLSSVPKEGPSIPRVPKEGPSQELLDWYRYDTVEEYLEDTFFDSTYKDTTNKDTTDKDSIDKDIIDESYSPKSKGKNVPVAKKPNLKVIFKSPIPIKGCVLGLANIQTWDSFAKSFGIKNHGNCANTVKGKKQV
ncbi:hypothetical protein Tco_0718754 [Tanacetum coccineum]